MRYEFTKPLIHATLLERDVEVSQWGGNLATEERYWLTNRGANLKNQFSRVAWAASQYYNPPTSAIKELKVPLKIGSLDPYYTDDIGNVSTSRFRSNLKEANLELKPRYPVFGGWKYSFRIGWDANLKDSLRKLKAGDGYILKVPFLEGPKMAEGVSYEKVEVRVILPEGATNVKFETAVPLVGDELLSHKTFMDTLGRTMLKLTAMNVVDASRDQDLIVSLKSRYFAHSIIVHAARFDSPSFSRPLWLAHQLLSQSSTGNPFFLIRALHLPNLPHHANSPHPGHIRLPLHRRLPQTHYDIPRGPQCLRHSVGRRKGRHQHWEVDIGREFVLLVSSQQAL